MGGVIPMLSAAVVDQAWITEWPTVGKPFAGLLRRHGLTDPDKLGPGKAPR